MDGSFGYRSAFIIMPIVAAGGNGGRWSTIRPARETAKGAKNHRSRSSGRVVGHILLYGEKLICGAMVICIEIRCPFHGRNNFHIG